MSPNEMIPSQVVHDGDTFRIESTYEGEKPVVSKVLVDIQGLSYLYNEFKILTTFLSECEAARRAIRKGRGADGKLVTILEWAEGCSLEEWLQRHPLPTSYKNKGESDDLMERVNIAKAIAHAVSQVHEKGVLHNRLTPGNIIIDMESGAESCRVKIIDFAHAEKIDVGEMVDGVDEQFNVDISGLGYTCNDLFLGGSDRHAPEAIVALIANLMQLTTIAYTCVKDAYLDLEQMVDLPDIFLFNRSEEEMSRGPQLLPGKLYGRNKELALLIDTYQRITSKQRDSPEVILISGDSGTGKSSLVEGLRGKVKANGGYFITGKFDQLRGVQPYTALITAFGELCDSILEMDSGTVEQVSLAIKEAVGEQGRVLTDVIPSLIKVIGEQPEVTDASGIDAHNRLVFLFRGFVRSISKTSNLVILSLLDLQWADSSSLALIKMLVTDSANHSLVFIGVYLDNDLTDTHPASLTLREIRKRNDNITNIKMEKLARQEVDRIISGELGMQTRFVRSLANVVNEKANGNVFFVIQILLYLLDERLLVFDRDICVWEWDEHHIRSKINRFDNVQDVVASRILKRSTDMKNILSVAAAIGSDFDEVTVVVATKDRESVWFPIENQQMLAYSEKEVHLLIHAAVREGLVKTTETEHKFRFVHDSIQKAAYSLLSLEQSRRLHLQIGSLACEKSSEDTAEILLFFAVDQLNKGSILIECQQAKIKLANLNLRAAQKAIKSSAFGSAVEYLRTGIELLCDGDWQDNSHDQRWESEYTLSLELFTSLAECLYCTGQLDQIENLVNEIFRYSRCFADKQRAHLCLIKCITGMGRLDEAIDLGFEGLAQVGEKFPSSVSTRVVLFDLLKTKLMLAGKSDEDVCSLPIMKNEDKLAAMKIMSDIGPTVFFSRPKYVPLLIFRALRLSLKFGLCNETANSFAAYGLILGTGLGQYRSGYRFGQLALTLAAKHNTREWVGYVYMLVYSSINHWVMPLEKTIYPLKYSHSLCMEAGAVDIAGYSACAASIQSFVSGEVLSTLEHDMQLFSQQMTEYSDEVTPGLLSPFHQCVLNLMGRSENPVKLTGEVMNEDMQISRMAKQSNKQAELAVYMNIVWLSYLFGDYSRAGEFVNKLIRETDVIGSQGEEIMKTFYCGLTCFALAKDTNDRKWKKIAMKSLKMIKKWSQLSPYNCLQKLFLLKAEAAILKRCYSKAEKYYYEALVYSRKHGFLNDEALAHERLGLFLSEKKNDKAAFDQLTSAKELYEQWGAYAKVKHIRRKLRDLELSLSSS
eukprot:CAMPEP_0198284428 /NCGR_PEP_ID=MMETSP1449-20131203/3902_1 /TAXON_ID=420275 /ORGANISM="Attheya septentrionalis, Strain CCMP2084" /LENGTH=1270 /DNA_ID=CAMNT_0043981491 /DNA_START=164 /DNA_END=3976 /DNA_ORIENTATION=+